MQSLFSPLELRSLRFKNRVFVSPMCMYSCAEDGLATPFHLAHLGRFALGGAALVLTEATAVSPEGRITPSDLGIWSDAHVEALRPITALLKAQGAVAGVQLAHAGRKASTAPPWSGGHKVEANDGGWKPVAPSAIAFAPGYHEPAALDRAGIEKVISDFVSAAKRARSSGFEVIELHFAHGYLVHEFLSPLTNKREDDYGGSRENRMKLAIAIASAVRAAWPAELPLFARISASDWAPGGWTIDDSVALARELRAVGVDLVDCSSGGAVPDAKIAIGPGYQVPFAEAVRKDAGVPTGAVGMITEPAQANAIVTEGKADAVLLARELLRDPNWPLHAATALGVDVEWPRQYARAKPIAR